MIGGISHENDHNMAAINAGFNIPHNLLQQRFYGGQVDFNQ